MIAYATVGTNDFPRAKEFYSALLGKLGGQVIAEYENGIGFAAGAGQPAIIITTPFDGDEATVGNGSMLALKCSSPEEVDALHALALELGGKDEGVPGARNDTWYMGYARDLDGNKLAFFDASKMG